LQRLNARLNLARILTVMSLAPPLIHPSRGDLPVLLSVPHSGRDYPQWLVQMASGGRPALASLEDPLVDRLAWRAIQRGIGAIVAQAPRAAIDCNRAEDEIDPAVVEGRELGRAQLRDRQDAERGKDDQLMVMGLVMLGAVETNKSAVGLDEVTPIATLTEEAEAIVVPADSKYRTLNDLMADLGRDPGRPQTLGI